MSFFGNGLKSDEVLTRGKRRRKPYFLVRCASRAVVSQKFADLKPFLGLIGLDGSHSVFCASRGARILVKPRATKIPANFFNTVKTAFRMPAFAPALA